MGFSNLKENWMERAKFKGFRILQNVSLVQVQFFENGAIYVQMGQGGSLWCLPPPSLLILDCL